MGLYPTLEDMTVANAVNAQQAQQQQQQQHQHNMIQNREFQAGPFKNIIKSSDNTPYPVLAPGARPDDPPSANYWNNSQTSQALQPVQASSSAVANYSSAPVSGQMVGIKRAEIKDGLRMVHICQDPETKKFGLKLKSIDAGIFVRNSSKNSFLEDKALFFLRQDLL